MKKKIISIVVLAITLISIGFNIFFIIQREEIAEYKREIERCTLELDNSKLVNENLKVELDNSYQSNSDVYHELEQCKNDLKN